MTCTTDKQAFLAPFLMAEAAPENVTPETLQKLTEAVQNLKAELAQMTADVDRAAAIVEKLS